MGFNQSNGFNCIKINSPGIPPSVPTGVFITGEGGEFILDEDGSGSRLVVE